MQKGEILLAKVLEPATNIQTAHGRRWVMPLRVISSGEIVKIWDNESPEQDSPLTRYAVGDEVRVRRLADGKNYVELVETNETAPGLPPPRPGAQTLSPPPKRVVLPAATRQRLTFVLEIYDRIAEHLGERATPADIIRLMQMVGLEDSPSHAYSENGSGPLQ